jgi:hypothetical protein
MLDRIKVSSSDVQRLASSIVTYLNSTSSDSNFSEGTSLHDLVVIPLATVIAAVEGDVRQLESRLSIQQLQEDETESATAMLDLLASNYFISRNTGTKAEGVVQLVLATNDPITIPIGTIFEKSLGVEFVYDQSTPLVVSSTEMVEETTAGGDSTGNYIASVFVISARDSIGSGTPPGEFSSMTNTPKGLVRIYNSDAFTIGEEQESNFEFSERMKEALTHRGFNTEASIRSVILDNVDSAKDVYVVGAGHPAMRRDLLNIGTENSIHTLGKVNIIVDTGFSIVGTDIDSAATYSFSAIKIQAPNGTQVPIKYSLGGKTFYGKHRVEDLPATSTYKVEVEGKYATIVYSDLNYARTLLQSVVITSTEINSTCRVYSPRSILAVETFVKNEGVEPLGVDTQLYYPALKLINISLQYTRNPELPADQFPEAFIQSSVSSYIKTLQRDGSPLNVAALYGYISTTFSIFISSVDFSASEVEYQLLLPSGANVHYTCTSDSSLKNSISYYINHRSINGVETEERVTGHVTISDLNKLQISDEYAILYCDPKDVSLVEVNGG